MILINKRNKLVKSTVRIAGLAVISFGLLLVSPGTKAQNSNYEKPNFVIIFCDDVGYNDFGCFGSKTNKTPNIDEIASKGIRFTSFYAQTVCGPSRGALMTSRYPTRVGGGWRVNAGEVTVAEILKERDYTTGCVGKWDMSERKYMDGLVPNDQGFDYYFGPLGANDRGKVEIYRNREAIYITHDMASLTGIYTDEAIQFLKSNKDSPFFLYLAFTMAHVVVDATEQFRGKSAGGLYGDVIEEIDWNVGRVMDQLKELGLQKNTYVLFTCDNGPWSSLEARFRYTHAGNLATGSAYPLRSWKGSVYEGGFRVPAVFWGPGRVPEGVVKDGMMSTLDVLPTFASLAGARIPDDRILDGFDQSEFVTDVKAQSNRDVFYYYIGNELQAVRQGKWKIVLPYPTLEFAYAEDPYRNFPELYDLEKDISEQNNLKDKYPEKLDQLLDLAKKNGVEPDPNTLIYATKR
jgi:arylsulfatase A-like enzyme